MVEEATGCRDETAARAVLADLERRAELVRAKIMTPGQDAVADHQKRHLGEHFGAYIAHLRAKRVSASHQKDRKRYLERIAKECQLSRLSDLDRLTLERWLHRTAETGMSARSCNAYRAAAAAFSNWCVDTQRLVTNPLAGLSKFNEKTDPRRKRRALTEEELIKLLDVARRRPLVDAMTIRKGPRRGEAVANLKPETRKRLETLGWERALIYKTLVLTGLRRNELASLTVGQLELDGPTAWAVLEAADEKNREGSEIALRADLVQDLREWLDFKLRATQENARRLGEPIPARLPANASVFTVPTGLVKIFDRDLKLAGIPKQDERGRTVDVHAMRTTFGTHLSKGGVPLRIAQSAMRHSDPSLTANVYTDPALLDVAGALDVLPALPLRPDANETQKATGTAGGFVPEFAPEADVCGPSESSPDKTAADPIEKKRDVVNVVTSALGTKKNPSSTADKESHLIGVARFELTTSCSQSRRSARLSYTPSGFDARVSKRRTSHVKKKRVRDFRGPGSRAGVGGREALSPGRLDLVRVTRLQGVVVRRIEAADREWQARRGRTLEEEPQHVDRRTDVDPPGVVDVRGVHTEWAVTSKEEEAQYDDRVGDVHVAIVVRIAADKRQ